MQTSTRPARIGIVLQCLVAAVLMQMVSFAGAAGRNSPTREGSASGEAAAGDCVLVPDEVHRVVRVIDAETFEIEDGREVRLIGALAPHPPAGVDANSWIPARDTLAFLTELIGGKTVEFVAPARTGDRYRRVLANVFVRGAEGLVWVQGALLEHGYARAYALPGHTSCLPDLMAREALARVARKGLWANPAFAPRPALKARGLMRERSRFMLVEGRVSAVAEKGRWLYINFGRDWRSDFTVAVPRRLLDRAGHEGQRLKDAAGHLVQVRGWIERRNGPAIEVVTPHQIEFLAKP